MKFVFKKLYDNISNACTKREMATPTEEFMDLSDAEVAQMIEQLKERESFISYLRLLLALQVDTQGNQALYNGFQDLGETANP